MGRALALDNMVNVIGSAGKKTILALVSTKDNRVSKIPRVMRWGKVKRKVKITSTRGWNAERLFRPQ